MTLNTWNWQQPEWPHFTYDVEALAALERDFARKSGVLTGSVKHISGDERERFSVQLMGSEALKTSEIEGELLDRDSIQSSIRKQLGLDTTARRATPSEAGIAEMMVDLYKTFAEPLSQEQFFEWHAMLCSGRRDLAVIGGYRTNEEDNPMQVVSNRLDVERPKVHFEAPPSHLLNHEMAAFFDWFNRTGPEQKNESLPLARAGIAHFYFLCIHPFEDGNGRIARAISEKALSQDVGEAALISLSNVIEGNKRDYYRMLELHNRTLDLTEFLVYFANVVLQAQANSQTLVEFLIEKAKFYKRHDKDLNDRQKKVVSRLFDAGPEGFEGGLSAKNYRTIAKAPSATATRDLQDLVRKNVLVATGALKSTRYWFEFTQGNTEN